MLDGRGEEERRQLGAEHDLVADVLHGALEVIGAIRGGERSVQHGLVVELIDRRRNGIHLGAHLIVEAQHVAGADAEVAAGTVDRRRLPRGRGRDG